MEAVKYPIPSSFAEQIAQRQYGMSGTSETLRDMYARVAKHLARAEIIDGYKKEYGDYPSWYKNFTSRNTHLRETDWLDTAYGKRYQEAVLRFEADLLDLMMRRGFVPGGRIMAGAGTPVAQLLNCFVFAPNGRYIREAAGDPDSIEGIYELNYQLAATTKTGGGCGINLDFLRESGARVHGSAGQSSGPVSYLRLQFNTTLRNIKLGGVRRGAGMATLSLSHPDALDFLTAKDFDREATEGKIEAFNLSFLVTDDFMRAVQDGGYHRFVSAVDGISTPPTPVNGKYHLPGQAPTNQSGNPADLATSKEIPLCARWLDGDSIEYVRDIEEFSGASAQDPVLDEFEYVVPARWLWDELAGHAWLTGDPGVLFVDRINEYNPLVNAEGYGRIVATNPCGEEPLFPGESCCLGSMVLSTYVERHYVSHGSVSNGDGTFRALKGTEGEPFFNTYAFRRDVKLAIRALDNVLTMNVHPLEVTMEACDTLRRVGLGVMGDADTMIAMGYGYASREAQELREEIAEILRDAAITASEELSKEKGSFPAFELSDLDAPRRNVFLLSIAPTGTIAMASDVNSGIEPIYGLVISRRVGDSYVQKLHPSFEAYLDETQEGWRDDVVARRIAVGTDANKQPVFSYEQMPRVLQLIMDNQGSIKGMNFLFTEKEQALWQTAHDVSPEDHVLVQAMWQNTLDCNDRVMAAISKTTNLPEEATVEDVKALYQLAFESRLKGITMYRNNSRVDQVLRTDSGKKDAPLTEADQDVLAAAYTRIEQLEGTYLKKQEEFQLAEASNAELQLAYSRHEEEITRLSRENEDMCATLTNWIDRPLRGFETQGRMVKANFKSPTGNSRKVYVYVGCNEEGYPVEVFIEDKRGGPEAHAYATALGVLSSLYLKCGGPAKGMVSRLKGIEGGSAAYTEGGIYQSVPDLVGRQLERVLQEFEERHKEPEYDDLDVMDDDEYARIHVPLYNQTAGERKVADLTFPSIELTADESMTVTGFALLGADGESYVGTFDPPLVSGVERDTEPEPQPVANAVEVSGAAYPFRTGMQGVPNVVLRPTPGDGVQIDTPAYKVCEACGQRAVPDKGRQCLPCENCAYSRCS